MNRSKRITLMLAVMIAYAVFCSNVTLSAPEVRQYGPFHSSSPDSGTCGNDWAIDTFDRFFKVHTTPNPDGTYNVVEDFKKGTFVTSGTTAGFIAKVFGAGATRAIPTFMFHYSAGNNGEWKNASEDRGGNQGDITGAP